MKVTQLYEQNVAIKNEKYNHLQQMKATIPRDYHAFFDALPKQISRKISDYTEQFFLVVIMTHFCFPQLPLSRLEPQEQESEEPGSDEEPRTS